MQPQDPEPEVDLRCRCWLHVRSMGRFSRAWRWLWSPVKPDEVQLRKQVSFQTISPMFAKAFAFSFVFRPYMKITVILCCAVVGAVVLAFVLKALGWFSHTAAEEE